MNAKRKARRRERSGASEVREGTTRRIRGAARGERRSKRRAENQRLATRDSRSLDAIYDDR